jgi:hypothetical protein
VARQLLVGSDCLHCGEQIVVIGHEAGCRWRRDGSLWLWGCQPDMGTWDQLLPWIASHIVESATP